MASSIPFQPEAHSMDRSSGGPRRSWVFMDAGDTFIYGYPTFYEALGDCFQETGRELSLEVHNFLTRLIHIRQIIHCHPIFGHAHSLIL